MARTNGNELVLVRGDGARMWDEEGREYLDATAALWYCNVGYGRSEIANRAAAQMRELPAYSCFGTYSNHPAEELCARVAKLAPLEGAKVFLTSGGSDAVDTAAKLVRAYWTALGQSDKRWIVARQYAYHGMHAYGTSLAGLEPNISGVGRPVPETAVVPWDSPEAIGAKIDELGPDRVGAVFGEPVICAGGVLPPPDGYWPAVAEICRERDVLLVADEVVTAWARVGQWFGCQRYDFTPDMILFAKGITSGYLPLGGVIVGQRVQEPFWSGEGEWFRHGYTYSGHASVCAAGLGNLDILEREDICGRAAALEPAFAAALESLRDHPAVSEVRTVGILGAVEVGASVADQAVVLAREHGVLTRSLRGSALHFSPALTITEAEISEMVKRVRRALDELA
jgi:putrescine---pyruvate transaminase